MIRKLIQISPSTAVVSLPSSWIKKNNLKKGSEISVEESDNRIILSSKSRKSKKECTIEAHDLDKKLIWRYVDAAYVTGYDTIIIKTQELNNMEDFEKVAKYFPGMMVHEERKNYVVLKDIADNPQDDLGKIISRIFNMKISMLEDGIEAMKKSDWSTLASMKKRDYSVNSYVSYCMRQLNKFGHEEMSKAGTMHTYLKVLEMLSDELAEFFTYLAEKKQKTDHLALSPILEIYRKIHRLHFSFNVKSLSEINEDRRKLHHYKSKNDTLMNFLRTMSSLIFELEELEMQVHA